MAQGNCKCIDNGNGKLKLKMAQNEKIRQRQPGEIRNVAAPFLRVDSTNSQVCHKGEMQPHSTKIKLDTERPSRFRRTSESSLGKLIILTSYKRHLHGSTILVKMELSSPAVAHSEQTNKNFPVWHWLNSYQ